ncbi:PTS sugar transporter subunit IIB [Thermoanaerobacter wiegelii]|uniref:PTS system sorbose subfamily IIB component n=1 Tax=Thermoanaerobacter wiegelii Rt8.B1 TaxID=697303 RepID=G2MTU0_9THEO|nr:PTS sugar transporter subunit IIB [Thermoanaerobacter wiegelii]AEM79475.1 PTS system sorbose subfamily IIB component [Thermoanaerobacter wiegelii Rt8.B1]
MEENNNKKVDNNKGVTLKMSKVVLFRIDERLIHGQVVTAWVGYTKAKNILVVDDESANNLLLSKVLKMAAPQGVQVKVVTIKNAADMLKNSQIDNIMIIVKTTKTAKELIDSCDKDIFPAEINVGNSGKTPEREKITSNVYLSENEIADLKSIKAKGFNIYFQMVPDDTKYTWEKVIKE